MYKFLKEKWHENLGDSLDCSTDDNFCQIMTPCDQVAPKLKSLSFQISGQTIELPPNEYLHQAEGTKCQFALHQNELKGSSSSLFLIGDVILRHLYQVYDFEQQTISLGVNKHSANKVLMYQAGKRPESASKVLVTDDSMKDTSVDV